MITWRDYASHFQQVYIVDKNIEWKAKNKISLCNCYWIDDDELILWNGLCRMDCRKAFAPYFQLGPFLEILTMMLWSCAVLITATPQRHKLVGKYYIN